MEDKNEQCLVLQFNPNGNKLIGIELTNTYNYWEKEAFIDMNQKQLFPYKFNGIKLKNFQEWFTNILMCPVSDKINDTLKAVKNNLPTVYYPGYD